MFRQPAKLFANWAARSIRLLQLDWDFSLLAIAKGQFLGIFVNGFTGKEGNGVVQDGADDGKTLAHGFG